MKVGNHMGGSSRTFGSTLLLTLVVGLTVLSACTDPGWPPPSTASTSTIPSSSSTLPGGGCVDYTPNQIAVSQLAVEAGGSFSVSGVVEPNDTVTVTLSGGSIGTVTLGTATADSSGHFTFSATAPDPIDPGPYTVSVTSTSCPNAGTATINVVAPTAGSCNGSRASRTFNPGDSVTWTLKTASFDTTKNVRLRISRQSYSHVLYNGAWPSGGTVTVTVPSAAIPGQYTIEQTGKKKNGTVASNTCKIWIEQAQYGTPPASVEGVSETRPPTASESRGNVLSNAVSAQVKGSSAAAEASSLPFTGGDAVSLTVVALVMLLGGFTLLRLRKRQVA